jgi:hypothetical protein
VDNLDIPEVSTPVNVSRLRLELKNHPDRYFADHLCDSFEYGFDTLVSTYPDVTKECRNLLSARQQPEIVTELVEQEHAKGFLLGPYKTPPWSVYRVSPIGVATGKYSGKHRLIVDLSSPHDDELCPSINDLIDKDTCSLTYVKIDDAISLIQKHGRGALLCKFDIADAFKVCPIRRDQWPLYGIKWQGNYYFGVRLMFGSRSSPVCFDKLSQAVCWIASNNYDVADILHLLDDYLTVQGPLTCGERTFALVSCIFHRLNIPLSEKKTEGPVTVVEYLGIILDTINMEARLPPNKVKRIIDFLQSIVHCKTCTKLQLLQLLGHLNFASRVILPGRSFVSYLITLSTTVQHLHHHVTLNLQCRLDIEFWLRFLKEWNGVSMFYEPNITRAVDMHLYTDAASTVGFSAYFDGLYFAETWPPQLLTDLGLDKTTSMSFMELYPIVASAVKWGHSWGTKRVLFSTDNLGVVEIIRKGRSHSPLIMKLMRRLTWCAATNNFTVLSEHVYGKDNILADALSRFQMDKFFKACRHPNPVRVTCPTPSEVMWY